MTHSQPEQIHIVERADVVGGHVIGCLEIAQRDICPKKFRHLENRKTPPGGGAIHIAHGQACMTSLA